MSRKFTNWDAYDSAEEQTQVEFKKGIYPVEIVEIVDEFELEYLRVRFDIIGGEHKGMFKRIADSQGNWPIDASVIRSYKATAMTFFKAFITAIEKSNKGYTFKGAGGDFQSLIGKKLFAVYADSEIPVPDDEGKPKVRVKFYEFRSLQAYQDGKIKVPEGIIRLDDWNKAKFEEALASQPVAQPKPVEATSDGWDDLPF